MRFDCLRSIYPMPPLISVLTNIPSIPVPVAEPMGITMRTKVGCSMRDIMDIEKYPSRWVQLPDDYTKTSIANLSNYYQQMNYMNFAGRPVVNIGGEGTVMCPRSHRLRKHWCSEFTCDLCGVHNNKMDDKASSEKESAIMCSYSRCRIS